jgi:signal peptidase I
LKSKRRKEADDFTPLGDSLVKDKEVIWLSDHAFITRPLNSVDETKLLFSHVSGSGRRSLFLAPGEAPLAVDWGGVERAKKIRIPKTRRAIRGTSVGLLSATSVLMVVLVIAQLTGILVLRNVATGSMRPGIRPGDIEVTVSPSYFHVHKGQIAIYQAKSPSGQIIGLVGHRIVGGNGKSGWVMKGDANPYADTQHPTTSQLQGIVVAILPRVGKYFNLKVAVYGLLGLVILWFGADIKKRRRRSYQ